MERTKNLKHFGELYMSDYYWSNGGLRRDTNENIEYVFKYLKKNNIKYKDTRNSNTYITIFNKENIIDTYFTGSLTSAILNVSKQTPDLGAAFDEGKI